MIKFKYYGHACFLLETDNEKLLFILNNFKIHQENKKNNAKKLIKEKKEEI